MKPTKNSTERSTQILQLVRFFTSGAATVTADYGTFALLHTLGAPLIVATSASLLAGFIVSFTLNRQWVFNAGSKNAQKRATLQLVLYATLFVANTAIAYFFIDYMQTLGMHPLIAKLLSIVMITTWNYLIYKKVIFRLKDPDPQQATD